MRKWKCCLERRHSEYVEGKGLRTPALPPHRPAALCLQTLEIVASILLLLSTKHGIWVPQTDAVLCIVILDISRNGCGYFLHHGAPMDALSIS